MSGRRCRRGATSDSGAPQDWKRDSRPPRRVQYSGEIFYSYCFVGGTSQKHHFTPVIIEEYPLTVGPGDPLSSGSYETTPVPYPRLVRRGSSSGDEVPL